MSVGAGKTQVGFGGLCLAGASDRMCGSWKMGVERRRGFADDS